jgi:hypothetical protein
MITVVERFVQEETIHSVINNQLVARVVPAHVEYIAGNQVYDNKQDADNAAVLMNTPTKLNHKTYYAPDFD